MIEDMLHRQAGLCADRSVLRSCRHSIATFLVAKLSNQYLSVFLEHAAFGARRLALGSLARGFIGIHVVGCTANNREQQQTNENNRLGKRDGNITDEQGRSDPCLVVPVVFLYKFGSEEERHEEQSTQGRESATLTCRYVVSMANLPGRRSSAGPWMRAYLHCRRGTVGICCACRATPERSTRPR